eukprot:1147400-Pelagomonas_calceolata.AAC.1
MRALPPAFHDKFAATPHLQPHVHDTLGCAVPAFLRGLFFSLNAAGAQGSLMCCINMSPGNAFYKVMLACPHKTLQEAVVVLVLVIVIVKHAD